MFEIRKLVIGAASLGWALLAFHNSGFAPSNYPPKALRQSQSGFVIDQSDASLQMAANLDQIRREPLSVAALRDLALGSARGQLQSAQAGLERAERVSRRDQWTQLFLIESSVQSGDVAGALKRYDTLLTVSTSLAPVLLDRLAAALISPEIRQQLPSYAKRTWMPLLLDRAARGTIDPHLAVDLARQMALLGPGLPDHTARNLVSALIARGEVGEAEAVADQLSDASHRGWRDPAFSAASTSVRLVPLTWELTGEADISVSLASSGVLDVAEISGKGALVAERLQRLAPGRYMLNLPIDSSDGGTADLRWQVSCMAAGNETALPLDSVYADKSLATRFEISASCRAAKLRLMYQPDDHQGTRRFRVGPLALLREGSRQ